MTSQANSAWNCTAGLYATTHFDSNLSISYLFLPKLRTAVKEIFVFPAVSLHTKVAYVYKRVFTGQFENWKTLDVEL
jgi:hypothetical protein